MQQTFECACFTVVPNPALFAQLKSVSQVHALNYAVSGARGEATFYVSKNRGIQSGADRRALRD
jgi:hypothetical protein